MQTLFNHWRSILCWLLFLLYNQWESWERSTSWKTQDWGKLFTW